MTVTRDPADVPAWVHFPDMYVCMYYNSLPLVLTHCLWESISVFHKILITDIVQSVLKWLTSDHALYQYIVFAGLGNCITVTLVMSQDTIFI